MSFMGDIVADGAIETPVQGDGGLNVLFTGQASVVADSSAFNTQTGVYQTAGMTNLQQFKAAMSQGPDGGKVHSGYTQNM